MSCERFREAIAGHAAGADLSPAAAAHLGSCEACTARLEMQRRLLADVDAELAGTLLVTAPPGFVSGVASRINAAEDRSISWRPVAAWIGLAAAAAIAIASFLRGPEPPMATPASAGAASATPAPPTPSRPAGNPAISPANRQATVRRARSAPSRPVAAARPAEEPPVIVGEDQARAIARLRELMITGRLTARMLPPERPHEAPELTVPPLSIPSIAIADVDAVGHIDAAPRERQ